MAFSVHRRSSRIFEYNERFETLSRINVLENDKTKFFDYWYQSQSGSVRQLVPDSIYIGLVSQPIVLAVGATHMYISKAAIVTLEFIATTIMYMINR